MFRLFRLFRLFCLFCPFILSSCKLTKQAADLSIEFNRQHYKTQGSPGGSLNEARKGINLALLFSKNLNPDIFEDEPDESAFNGLPDNALASSDIGMAPNSFSSLQIQSDVRTTSHATSNIPKELYGMGGIELALKASDDAGEKINLFYLEIPLYALYVKELNQGKVYGGLGPYLAYGLGGKSEDNNGGVTEKFNSFDKELGFKPFDTGLNITAGYTFANGFGVRLDYASGFANIGRDVEKITNKTFALHAMYYLNKAN